MKYLIRNKALFVFGVLVTEPRETLLARCKELKIRNVSGYNEKQLIQLILDHTEESTIGYNFDPELVAA